ncbi:porin family protein [Marinifilum flexuosum]|uniref:Uncharacterized protein n=1 Tax=Marinifilum flexuosum TaxID=1117708 RepID=A0A419X6W1_9BACT|nr:outer membrane beta-barrel protein [Marinifilum flexuosum]RKE03504.1 hypothetical protein BXY64_0509 [Marinifilum flexuosum]
MKKHLIVLLSLVSLLTFSAFSQNDFRKGYVITTKGDTLHGQVAYTLKSKNYRYCIFKKDERKQKFSSDEIIRYAIDGNRTFVNGVVDDSFVELLIEGEINLYKKASNFYVQKNNGDIHLLEKYIKKKDDFGEVKTENKRWRGILFFLVKDRLEGKVSLQRFEFSEKYLTELIRDYNISGGMNYHESKADIQWVKTQFGPIAGFNFEKLYIDNKSSYYYYYNQDINQLNPFIGVAFNIYTPRLSEKFSLQLELQLSKLDVKKEFHDEIPGYKFDNTHTIEATKLSIPFAVKYDFYSKKLKWHILGGILAEKNFNADYYTIVNRFYNDESDSFELRDMKIKDNQTGYWIGFGVEKKIKKVHARLGVRYYKIGNLLYHKSIDVKQNRLSFNLFISM